MDAIQAARELGYAIQQDPRYLRILAAQEANDSDIELQALIDSFNVMRGQLGHEVQKRDKDNDLIKEMDAEVKEKYQLIFENEHMKEFTEAREEFQQMVGFVNQIVSGSASGQDPALIEYQAACGGSCGSCEGCG